MKDKTKLGRPEVLKRVRKAASRRDYLILPHARRRCDERDVKAPHIEHILATGRAVPGRDRFDEDSGTWSYCLEGRTVDLARLRVVVAFEGTLLVVTVVRLDERED